MDGAIRLRAAMKASIALIAACCLMQAGMSVAALPKAATHTIVIEGAAFVPSTLTVKRGDRVVWVNKDPFPHTATAQDRSFDSRVIAANKSWTFTAKKAGEFPYACKLHPTMKATLIVE